MCLASVNHIGMSLYSTSPNANSVSSIVSPNFQILAVVWPCLKYVPVQLKVPFFFKSVAKYLCAGMYIFQKKFFFNECQLAQIFKFYPYKDYTFIKKNVIFSSKFQRIFLFKVIFKKEKKFFFDRFCTKYIQN